MGLITEHVCGRHLNKRMIELLDNHPEPNLAYYKGVNVRRNARGGSVSCVVCGKTPPNWQLEYQEAGS